MPCPSHHPWFDLSNFTWRRVHPMKTLIPQRKAGSLIDASKVVDLE
jgi:hypothetical protein